MRSVIRLHHHHHATSHYHHDDPTYPVSFSDTFPIPLPLKCTTPSITLRTINHDICPSVIGQGRWPTTGISTAARFRRFDDMPRRCTVQYQKLGSLLFSPCLVACMVWSDGGGRMETDRRDSSSLRPSLFCCCRPARVSDLLCFRDRPFDLRLLICKLCTITSSFIAYPYRTHARTAPPSITVAITPHNHHHLISISFPSLGPPSCSSTNHACIF